MTNINPLMSVGDPETEPAITFTPAPDVELTENEVEIITQGIESIAFIATHLDEITELHDENGATWHLGDDGTYISNSG